MSEDFFVDTATMPLEDYKNMKEEIERLNKELDIAIDICNKRQVEIVRLNNIITELEKYIESFYEDYIFKETFLDKLKELKEKK